MSQAQQQRLRLRRLHRLPPAERARQRGADGFTLRQPARRPGDAVRPLPADDRRARSRRLAGRQAVAPAGAGTFRADSPTFVVLLIGVVVIVAALTFFPAFLLGPVVQGLTEQLF